MKYFILISSLIFSFSAFSHDGDEDHSKVTIETIKNLSPQVSLKIFKKAFLELSRKGDLGAQMLSENPFLFVPEDPSYKTDIQTDVPNAQVLTGIRTALYWSLQALEQALEKRVCVGDTVKSVDKYTQFIMEYLNKMNAEEIKNIEYKSNVKNMLESFESYVPYYYAIQYMQEKLRIYYTLPDTLKQMAVIFKITITYSLDNEQRVYELYEWLEKWSQNAYSNSPYAYFKLNEKNQKKIGSVVSKWEEKLGDEPYNVTGSEECDDYREDYQTKVFNKKMIEIYLKGDY